MQDQKYQATQSDLDSDTEQSSDLYRINRFIKQLYRILRVTEEKGTYRSIIQWSADGEAIVISDPIELVKMLPYHFKARNFTSFVRQLNMYNFHKVRGYRKVHVFRHPFFTKDNPENLKYVKRKSVKKTNIILDNKEEKSKSKSLRTKMISKLVKSQKLLDEKVKQNQDLRLLTKNLAVELRDIKTRCDAWIHQILTLLITVVQVPQSPLTDYISEAYRDIEQMDAGKVLLTCKNNLESVFACENNGAIEMRHILETLTHIGQFFINYKNLNGLNSQANSLKPSKTGLNGSTSRKPSFDLCSTKSFTPNPNPPSVNANQKITSENVNNLLSPILKGYNETDRSFSFNDENASKALFNTTFDEFMGAVVETFSAIDGESVAMGSSLMDIE